MKLQAKTKRGYLFLETHEFEKANSFFESALNDDSEDSYAYIGKLLIDLKLANIEELDKQLKPFDNNRNYELAYRFADDELKAKLDDYRNNVIANIERKNEQQQEAKYTIAVLHKESAKTKQEYSDAIKDLLRVGLDYKDVKNQIAYCREKITDFDYNETIELYKKFESFPDNQAKVDDLLKVIERFKTLGEYKDSEHKVEELNDKVNALRDKIEKEKAKKEILEQEEKEAKREAEKKAAMIKAVISAVIIIVVIISSIGGFFIYRSNVNKKMSDYISLNQTAIAYDYYIENSPFLENKKRDLEMLIKSCVINADFDTLLDVYSSYDYLLRSADISDDIIIDIIKQNIDSSQYEQYYNAVYTEYHISSDSLFYPIYNLNMLYKVLPDDYKDVPNIKSIYKVLVDAGVDGSDDPLPYDKLAAYADYQPLNNYLVESDKFISGRWSDNKGNYIRFYEDDEGEHCTYNLETPSDSYRYDYYRIIDGKYNMYVEDDESDNVDCFKFQVINQNKMEVYNYTDKRTYIMTRN